MHHITKQQVI